LVAPDRVDRGRHPGGAAPGASDMSEQQDYRALSFGERAVGLTFNPSGDHEVTVIKQAFAQVIDFCNNARNEEGLDPEIKRMFSVAITEAQTAQMWAVKAITWRSA
jgi:hypothetical protein